MGLPSIAEYREPPFVSTGHLPDPDIVQSPVFDAYLHMKANKDGQSSQVYLALARVPSDLFGVCVIGTSGRVYDAARASGRGQSRQYQLHRQRPVARRDGRTSATPQEAEEEPI